MRLNFIQRNTRLSLHKPEFSKSEQSPNLTCLLPKPRTMNKSFANLFDHGTTIIIEPPRNKRIPVQDTENIILNGLNKRMAGYPGLGQNPLDAAIIKVILETNQDLNNLNTYIHTPFQSILLLKKENIFDTKGLILTCISNFITPHMITNYTIKQLMHYSYTLAHNPSLITKICKTKPVSLYHDYYMDLSIHQQKQWYTYNLT